MKQFRIFENGITNQLEVIKVGFSWPGFFFGWIWAAVKALPLHSIVLFVISFALAIIEISLEQAYAHIAGSTDEEVLSLAVMLFYFAPMMVVSIVVGNKGNDWRAERAMKKGFVQKEIVFAANPSHALICYVSRRDNR